jgi:hypothetical protein
MCFNVDGATMLWNEHMSVNVNMWTWMCDQEWVYLEYFDDKDRIFLKYLMPCKNDVENIFPHVHGWKTQNGENWALMNFLDDDCK